MHNFNFFAEKSVSSYKKSDTGFILLVVILWGIGLVTLYLCSAAKGESGFGSSFYFVKRQLVSSLAGFVFFLLFSVMGMEKIRKIIPLIVIASIILCLLTFVPGIGVSRNGARRWIRMPYFSTFQPSEAIKFASVLYLANIFDKQEKLPAEEKNIAGAILGLVVFTLVIFAQSDFSTCFFVFFIGLLMFFAAGAKLKWFLPVAGLGLPVVCLMIFLEPYRMNRIIGFLAKDSHQQTYNFQMSNSIKAISNGGIFGQGFGSGMTKAVHVPEVQSDYVFAGWAEATGLFGVIIYIALLFYFIYKIFKISTSCGDYFAALASFGFGASIAFQSMLNIAVVGGVLPSTGIPLPFFSSGGSSMMCTLAMCGFIVNASRISDEYENEIYSVGDINL